MRRTRLWIGRPVIEISSGERIGVVSDVLFNEDNSVCSLVVDRDGLLSGKGKIQICNVHSVGEDAVTIESNELIDPPNEEEDNGCLLSGDYAFVGKELFTEEGTVLGVVADVYIEEDSDNIVGYEVSDGLIADLVSGRKWLPFEQTVQIGDRIIVKADSELSELQPSM